MSLISSIAAIATAGAGGGESYWASSVRITTTTVSGQSMQDKTNSACQFGAGGDIIQCISSNSEGTTETNHNAYICRLDPTDGSLIGTSRFLVSNKNHRFRPDSPVFYHPTMNKCIARVSFWWDSSGNTYMEDAAAVINTSGNTDTILNNTRDNISAGNGNYLISYVSSTARMHNYNASTGAVSSGPSIETVDNTAFSQWSSQDSSDMTLSARYQSSSQRVFKMSQSTNSFGGASAIRDIPALNSGQFLQNDNCNRSKVFSSSGIYGWADKNNTWIFEIYSSLSNYRSIDYTKKSSYNGQPITMNTSKTSMVVTGGSLYQCSPVIFRKVGDPQNSVLYAIFQINPSTFQVTRSLAVMSDAGAEYVDSNSGFLESNVEGTCIYLSYIHSKTNSRGGESDKVLKLPLDFSTIPDQTLSFNSTHDNIRIWNFSNTSTGGAYPVFNELFTINYTGAAATYNRSNTVVADNASTPTKVAGVGGAARTLLHQNVDITTT